MPKANFPVAAGEPPHVNPAAARELRASEQLITDWERETTRLGRVLALMTLDVSAMTGPKWSQRFIIAVAPVVEDSSFLFYGHGFASLMELPETPDNSAPIVAQLPARYVPVVSRGCIVSALSSAAIRMQGTVVREDGRQELYRAALIRLSLDTNRQRHLALGALNCRITEDRVESSGARTLR
jgi:hypothetical protein